MNDGSATSVRPTTSGDQAERLSALFRAHADRLYRLARRLVPAADDALDLVQETFLKAARSPESIPYGSRDEEAWLVRVLINTRRDQWRKEAVRRRHEPGGHPAPVEHADPERAFLIRTIVWQALDYLPPRRRAVVVMHELEGLSIASIASLLGINVITVRWHLSRGRRELAKQLRVQLGEGDEPSQNSLAERRPAPSRSSAP
jgi:RNA polymerase sigma-70 factor (ECF subfamily)